MRKPTLLPRFTNQKKKMIVAESLLPINSPSTIAKKHKIDLDILSKWRDKYEYDRLVTAMVQNFLHTQMEKVVPMETIPVQGGSITVPKQPKADTVPKKTKAKTAPVRKTRRSFSDAQKMGILQEALETSNAYVIEKYKLSDAIFYKWKKQTKLMPVGYHVMKYRSPGIGSIIGGVPPEAKPLKVIRKRVDGGNFKAHPLELKDAVTQAVGQLESTGSGGTLVGYSSVAPETNIDGVSLFGAGIPFTPSTENVAVGAEEIKFNQMQETDKLSDKIYHLHLTTRKIMGICSFILFLQFILLLISVPHLF